MKHILDSLDKPGPNGGPRIIGKSGQEINKVTREKMRETTKDLELSPLELPKSSDLSESSTLKAVCRTMMFPPLGLKLEAIETDVRVLITDTLEKNK